jgi:ABC-type sulfate/molybdate transport systems ATPase subunit
MLLVQSISFSYQKKTVVDAINFQLEKGKTMALIGESGCGKSTLLKLIYGLHDLNLGSIYWNDLQVLGPEHHLIPGVDEMKYLAQDFDLMPYITVSENVGKYLSNFYPEIKQSRINELLEVVEMEDYADVKVMHLSGGQMQRVALAKVLAKEPELLLLDEPFSHIDNFRRNSLRRRLFSYLAEKEITCIIATHDAQDVLSFCDQVLVLKDGKKLEFEDAKTLYNEPKSFYTASLFGDVNMIKVNGEPYFIYPHQLKVSDNPDFQVEVLDVFFRGSHYLIDAAMNGRTLYFEHDSALEKGATVGVEIQKKLVD